MKTRNPEQTILELNPRPKIINVAGSEKAGGCMPRERREIELVVSCHEGRYSENLAKEIFDQHDAWHGFCLYRG